MVRIIISLALAALAVGTSIPDDEACEAAGCAETGAMSMLQRRSGKVDAGASAMSRFLEQLWAQGRCDDGPGDLRGGSCAQENCKRCLGPGARLSYDRNRDYTTCEYHPSPGRGPNVFCGEGFGRTPPQDPARAEKCRCCRGPGATLVHDPSSADGLGYTYCRA
mmetsp:Transcript_35760/g.103001  ORF Transcript_35760/g.103001 Transcript_35760/m.103001 type:complete len:164 (-) Transcript_35760:56-547(-)